MVLFYLIAAGVLGFAAIYIYHCACSKNIKSACGIAVLMLCSIVMLIICA